jgi:hypothetical protein
MGNDEWDALEHYLRAGAALAAQAESTEAAERPTVAPVVDPTADVLAD